MGHHLSQSHLTGKLLCNRPATYGRAVPLLLDFAPDEVYRANPIARVAVGSYPTFSPLPGCPGGLFSVALSIALRRPGVTRRHALRSPDFPRTFPIGKSRDGPACLPYSFILRRPRLPLRRPPIQRGSRLRSDRAWRGPFRSGSTRFGCSRGKTEWSPGFEPRSRTALEG